MTSAIHIAKQALQRWMAATTAAAAANGAVVAPTACCALLNNALAASPVPLSASLRVAVGTASAGHPLRADAAQAASSNEAASLISAIEQLMCSIGSSASTQSSARPTAASSGMTGYVAQAGHDSLQMLSKQEPMQHSQLHQVQLPFTSPFLMSGLATGRLLQPATETTAAASSALRPGELAHQASGSNCTPSQLSALLQQHEWLQGQQLQSISGGIAAPSGFSAPQQEVGAAAAGTPDDNATLVKQMWLGMLQEKHAQVQMKQGTTLKCS
jgi:hypothetical protein